MGATQCQQLQVRDQPGILGAVQEVEEAAEVEEDAVLCLRGRSDLSAQSLVTEQCGWVSRAHSTADPAFPALQAPQIPLAAPALAARHGLWCSVRLEQGEKRDILVMNGMVEILPMFFLPFLWFTY